MILTNKQCEKLIKVLYQDKVTERQQKLAIRNVTMASFMLEAGLRTTEVVNLSKTDIFLADKPLAVLNLVRGIPRGHNCRSIPLSENILFFVKQMNDLWWKPDAVHIGNFAFYDRSSLRHITATQFRRIIKKAGLDAFGSSIRPNLLRRTCAARLLKETDKKTVQICLDYKTDQDSFFC